MTNTSTHYRKVRSLIAKTVANGCTAPEHVSATNLAATLVKKHDLDAARIDWPTPPAGFAWSGEPGRSVVMELPAEPKPSKAGKLSRKAEASPKPAKEAKVKKPSEPKAKGPSRKEQIIAMLRQPGGTTIDALVARFGVQRHSARASISVFGREIGGVSYDKATGVYRAVAA